MSGHSQFKNIMYRKGAQDAKRAKAFAKLGREILVAAKLGSTDPQANPRLRAALAAARTVNMPNDNINRILKKALGEDNTESYEDIRFEGFGVGGVSVIVEALTDNRHRTVPEIRSTFSKFGGNLGELGSVSFLFEHDGYLLFPRESTTFDDLFEKAVEAGAENVEEETEEGEESQRGWAVFCSVENFGALRDALTESFGEPSKAEIIWKPVNTLDCDFETVQTLLKMIDALEDNDDVQKVFTNFSCGPDVQARLDAEFV
ncbi:putative transcriptional regulatory protein [Alphaproteobacteria bacterium]|nr:putative transcriptional regulatory protein [Alphaproteobacteria bacterium]GHS97769.1 putative transcriptional regulatory protein [Alphaproteobacteria bacterium]